jgi:hypothetical protein
MPHRRHAIVAVPGTHLLWSCCAAITAAAGHAFLGLHLAKKLLSGGHKVTILNDGDEAKLSAKAPFSQYASLDGAQVVWGSPADPSSYPEGSFDVVYDNNGKKMDDCQPLIDHFKVWITACSWRWQLSRISHTRSHCAFLTAACSSPAQTRSSSPWLLMMPLLLLLLLACLSAPLSAPKVIH